MFVLSLQQQQRKPENEEAFLAYQARGNQGVPSFPSSSGTHQLPQQLHSFVQNRDESHNKAQGIEHHHMQNPIHQAYIQYAHQAAAQQKSALGNHPQEQQGKMAMMGAPSAMGNFKMQELMSLQAANQAHASASRKTSESFAPGETQMDQGTRVSSEQRIDSKPVIVQSMAATSTRPHQGPQGQANLQNIVNNQQGGMTQVQAMQTWALEHNIDLSLPANVSLISQILPLWQAKMAAMQKANETQPSRQLAPKQHNISSPAAGSENSAHVNSSSDMSVSGLSVTAKAKQVIPSVSFASTPTSTMVNANNVQVQQLSRQTVTVNGMPPMHPPLSSSNTIQGIDSSHMKSNSTGADNLQMQYLRQLNRTTPHSAVSSNDGGSSSHLPSQAGPKAPASQQLHGFTKQQLHVLKAQIMAFRRLKRGEGNLPPEVLQAIAPPPLVSQLQQAFLPSPGTMSLGKSDGKDIEEHARRLELNENVPQVLPSSKCQSISKEETFTEEKITASAGQSHMLGASGVTKDPVQLGSSGNDVQSSSFSIKSEHDVERGLQNTSVKGDQTADRGKSVPLQVSVTDTMQVKKSSQTGNVPQNKDSGVTRKYPGPLFDVPFFTRKHDSFGSAVTSNNTNNLTLAYDVKDLLFEEGMEVLIKKKDENLKKIGGLLAVNLERKRISPDLVVRLQIEEKKLRLLDLQTRVRDEVDQQQHEIMAMPDRPYRKFVRDCERQRMELARQVQLSQRIMREKQLKSIFQWRKKLLESHWAIRDARTARNRGVAKYHERMLKEFSKRKDEDRTKRMEALKNNDVDRYREMLLEQQTSMPGDAAQRYSVLSSFLSQTEEYLHKLGGKITATKNQQEGLSEEEVRAAATCAGEEVTIRNRFSEMNAPKESSSVNKYYNLAHAVSEKVVRQPSMLRTGVLREYQLVGLQWMLSLYNNKLNGILADEMGLGKTVQVMALIAYLMEFKGNYGPHLIIVPNAVLVNWKSELHTWLPSVSCIYYVGAKEQRAKLFSQEVCAMKFNVLVTTYEFIMFDRAKLSKVDWKYIVIDEAQRMKDRESVLARDLDRYRCQRRLLLTGTPLQNDLKELWSLLNLLLPEVFDNRKAFHDWFSKPFQKDAPSHDAEDDWLETEKKVIIIHRLHQILEPFMLRRRVEDVEGSLPRKVSIVLRCRMSAIQGAIYDWIKSTGTIRVDPADELKRVIKNPNYQAKVYKILNNRCMELRKACNHPLLNYPYFDDYTQNFVVRSCGKLWILDRILIKLQRTGHRVLLFSTMTKLLDVLEEYLNWRKLIYRRIDGTTSLEDRESAIVDFNKPGSDCFIFLLSIRAAGRGLNLQTADTVVIYDPDPNPKNEEQAVARAHRIGQKREVKVIYLEAVVDKIPSHQKEDEIQSGGNIDSEDELVGKDRYIGSIESLIRNNIQQYKIDMADEVINAGRFDQRTTHEERRMTLETLLHDEERYQETVHNVPSLQEVNRMIARSEEEVEIFNQIDEDFNWTEEMTNYEEVPDWLRSSSREVNSTIAKLSKKPSKKTSVSNVGIESSEVAPDLPKSPVKTERRGRLKSYRTPDYRELDYESGEFSEASAEEKDLYPSREEEGDIGEFDEDESNKELNKEQSEEDLPCDGDYEFPTTMEISKKSLIIEQAGSSGSSSECRRLAPVVSPSISSQKFGSLSALDAKPGSLSKRLPDELEEGEIAVSGDSHLDLQQSGSHDRDDGEDEQVLQPKLKRKRSMRYRPRQVSERLEDKPSIEKFSMLRGNSSQLVLRADHDYEAQLRPDSELETYSESADVSHDSGNLVMKNRRNVPSKRGQNSLKSHAMVKRGRSNCFPVPSVVEHSKESWDDRALNTSGSSCFGTKMSDIIQRKCKNVVNKLQKRIAKDGHQTIPLLMDFWKRTENSSYLTGVTLDLRRIDQRVDRSEYNGVVDFVADVQSMLKEAAQYFGFSLEVRSEARKVQDLFFDIMMVAFPDTDLREVRNTVLFSATGASTSALSPKPSAAVQNKRHKLLNNVELEQSPSKQFHRRSTSTDEEVRTRGQMSKFHKESGVSGRDQGQPDEVPLHPGELVTCKKRRNDRDKSVTKSRTGPVSPQPTAGRFARSPATGPITAQRDPKLNQQGWPQQPTNQRVNSGGSGSGGLGWATPVKRTRTDSGKRRPSLI
ncbi:hypothetical protein GIB67_037276 [Kingdonia uniflora]|uniref:ATP-dependent helicase BRM n=1 Tax=Kingdonia uniflora TaxID=39325 RepID=A0A7J7MS59_9MAGN|nr:hypothetical protein GIB67_037276 [Kingdonia uniflora]